MKTQRVFSAIVMSTLAIMFVACGATTKVREAADRVKYMNDMKSFAISMINYHDSYQKMPSSVDELTKKMTVEPDSLALVKSGELNVVWGPWKMKDQLNGTSMTVMAWSTSPVFKGNVGVIYCDGSVMQLTPAEFAAAPKATVVSEMGSPVKK